MSHVQPHLIRIAVAAAMFGGCHPTSAVDLAPGDSRLVRTVTADIVTPGVNLASNPSLAGTVVADATRSFSFVVTTFFAGGGEPETRTQSGEIHDWVVRRSDTGRLDFYTSITSHSLFGGTIVRPWQMGGASVAGAAWRDDSTPPANPPTRLALALDGRSASAEYFTNDDNSPNWIEYPNPSAPVLFRSNLATFGTGLGSLVFSYGTEFSSSNGQATVTLFGPAIPEPQIVWLVLAGLAAVAVRVRHRA
jgi:hypothetical protein